MNRVHDDEHCTSPDAREAYRMRAGKRLAEHENARKKADRRADVLDEPISESGVLFAAVANKMSGTAVIGPVSTKRTRVCHASSDISGEKNTL